MDSIGYFIVNEHVLEIKACDNYIVSVKYVKSVKTSHESIVIRDFKQQLEQYFAGQLQEFKINYQVNSLPFRKRVYELIQAVGYGHTSSVRAILTSVGLSKGNSVICRAMLENPLLLIIPCHRINNSLRRVYAYSYPKAFRDLLLSIEKEH